MSDTPNSQTVTRLLVVDDDREVLEMASAALSRDGLRIACTTDPEEGLRLVYQFKPQMVLTDLHMPKMGGMELLERITAVAPEIDVVIMTGDYSTELAVEAIQKGAADYLNKPLPIDKLTERVERLMADRQRWQQGLQMEGELLPNFEFEGMVGRSPAMIEVFDRIRRVGPHFRTVLITGATGTGKELVARALHRRSPVSEGPFAVCNCAALVETLIEAELFGHVKGAFTGAVSDRMGLFEYANNGVIFLDEIGEMPYTVQAKLLRVLQNKEVQRVGSPTVRKIDVRVIAATHRDLRKMVARRKFREDLYYRLGVVEIPLPKLVERTEDLPLLETLFLRRFSAEYRKPAMSLTRRAQLAFTRYPWPGNVRELENVLGHACMMAEDDTVDVRNLPESFRNPPQTLSDDEEFLSIEELNQRHVKRVLERMDGNRVAAAKILKIGRSTLYKMLRESEHRQ